jgi:hypothetical protein
MELPPKKLEFKINVLQYKEIPDCYVDIHRKGIKGIRIHYCPWHLLVGISHQWQQKIAAMMTTVRLDRA